MAILRMYAIVRGDLNMPAGKLAAQAGHAFVEAYRESQIQQARVARQYIIDPPGTKVVLKSKSLKELEWAKGMCHLFNIPHAWIVDSGHILPPYFDGNPIVTALGIGPILREDIQHITSKFELV